MKQITSLCIALLLTGCGAQPDGERDPYRGTWLLGKLNGQLIPTAAPAPRPSLTIDGEQMSLSLGCNRFNGNWPQPGDEFGPQASTRMACKPPLDKLELDYAQGITRVTGYRIEYGRLQLLVDDQPFLEAYRTPDQQRIKSLDGGWRLTELSQQERIHGLFDGSAPYLVLELASGKAYGNTGCNQYFATAALAGEGIWLGPAGTTLVACSPEQDSQERRIMGYFEQAERVELQGDTLTWWQGSIRLMSYQRTDDLAEP